MAKPVIKIEYIERMRVVRFEIPGGVTTPNEFASAVAEAEHLFSGDEPVLMNGRGPIWGYCMLTHAAHATPAVACFDPRLGYVVVQSHDARYKVGDCIADPQAE